jgi:GNAT superfamily N-acetyltransferase
MQVSFFDDGAPFLAEAEGFLATDPLTYSVVATTAQRGRRPNDPADKPFWFAILREEDEIVAVAMRTHPDAPYAGFAPGMPVAAVDALTRALAERGERVAAWNGNLESARALCVASGAVGRLEVAMHLRMFEAHRVIWPTRPAGSLRQATEADEAVIVEFLRGFNRDAELQGGREPNPLWAPNLDDLRSAVRRRGMWLWEVGGVPVHLTGVNRPMFGVARIGPVFTPADHRGHGYASWIVAELTQQVLDAGARPCLYTDQANPVSSLVYERIGYEPVHDEGNVVVV